MVRTCRKDQSLLTAFALNKIINKNGIIQKIDEKINKLDVDSLINQIQFPTDDEKQKIEAVQNQIKSFANDLSNTASFENPLKGSVENGFEDIRNYISDKSQNTTDEYEKLESSYNLLLLTLNETRVAIATLQDHLTVGYGFVFDKFTSLINDLASLKQKLLSDTPNMKSIMKKELVQTIEDLINTLVNGD